MAESTGAIEPVASRVPMGTTVRFVLGGAAFGGIMGLSIVGFEFDRLHPEHPLPALLLIFPIVGALVGYWTSRSPETRGWRRTSGFFATEPPPMEDRKARERRVARTAWIGFGVGIAIGLAASALDFAWRGWWYLSQTLGFSLFFFPYFGACLGFNAGLRPGDPRPSLRNLRFRTRTLMIMTAYLAVWYSLVMRASEIGVAARRYHDRMRDLSDDVFEAQLRLADAVRHSARSRYVDELRAGRIPDGLPGPQKEFLESLDRTATDEEKKESYRRIADMEEGIAESNARVAREYARSLEYAKALAEKYEKAARRPWLAVEPDPPDPRQRAYAGGEAPASRNSRDSPE